MQEEKNETFNYTYSARQQEELEAIRKKYLPPEENKLAQLRRLDAGVARKAVTASLSVGILGALLLGVGMCCCMVWMGQWFIPGILIGAVGLAVVSLAYPLYTHVLRKERERVAPMILRLTEELMK